MKRATKFANLLLLTLLLINYGCSKEEIVEILSLQDLVVTIDENPTVGQIIGTIQTNGVGTTNFSITSETPAGALNIDASTGELTVLDATLFDFEANPIVTAVISSEGALNTATVTINLNDVDEIGVQNLNITIDENPTAGQVIGNITTIGMGTVNFSITSETPAGALSIDANTGELTVANAAMFDYETNPIITAVVSSVGALNTGTVTINLNDLNEISVQDFNTTIDENPTVGQVIGTVQTNGVGSVNFSITSETPAGALSINSTTGELTVANAAMFDYETNPTITAVVSSVGALNTGTVTINLNDVAEGATIGDFRDGGVVFWVDPTDSNHGLVIAMNSVNPGEWGCQGTTVSPTYSDIGRGAANTALILSTCTTPGIAADLAASYDATIFGDWFLPSRFELTEYHANKSIVDASITANGGNIPNQYHWSSTQSSSNLGAFAVNVTTGVSGTSAKSTIYGVRAVRAF